MDLIVRLQALAGSFKDICESTLHTTVFSTWALCCVFHAAGPQPRIALHPSSQARTLSLTAMNILLCFPLNYTESAWDPNPAITIA